MDLTGIPTLKLDWESSNLPKAWKTFQQHVQLIFDAALNDNDNAMKTVQVTFFMGWDVFGTRPALSAEIVKTFFYFKKFKAYVQPKLNPV